MSDILSVKVFETFDIISIRKFLELNKNRFFLNDFEISKFEDNVVDGKVFLDYTEEKLVQDGIRRGPAHYIAEYIARVNNQKQPITTTVAARSPKSPNNFVTIFIDTSNLIIEGSKVIGYLEEVNISDYRMDFYIDYGLLVTTILKGQKLINKVIIFGSVPPNNDTLWVQARDYGFRVITYPRNTSNKEKKVDAEFICIAMRTIFTESPGTILLVANNSGYCRLIEAAHEENWNAELWFWYGFPNREDYPFTTPISKELRNLSLYDSLDKYYKQFTYITGPDLTNKKHTLKIHSSIIKDWHYKNETLMRCFCTLKLFGRWHWVDDTVVHLYFENKNQLESAKLLFKREY
ncbi:unnamed protein product [Rhizophagus irregularis]|uniref:NYN domain-containing protein n=1 Tax=Rhizophagus irregularis TaxID=588596 RepID=A0A2I1H108_9GLOM|nr:hypothetical protein RhiirA4_496964 [Rhizophagus irregularis]CAB4404324.1 unnamed protein product [Rhizophagus irregularis]